MAAVKKRARTSTRPLDVPKSIKVAAVLRQHDEVEKAWVRLVELMTKAGIDERVLSGVESGGKRHRPRDIGTVLAVLRMRTSREIA